MVSLSTYCDLTKAHFDAIIGDPTSPTITATITGLILALIGYSTGGGWTYGNTTADGTEQTIYSLIEADTDSVDRPHLVEGVIDLSEMQAGDIVVIKESISIPSSPLDYQVFGDHTYTGVQTEPLTHFTMKPIASAYKVTLEQTAGTYRDYKSLFQYKRQKG